MAILFGALAPTATRAMASADRSASLLEICTTAGYKAVKQGYGEDGKPPVPVKPGMEHCAFCSSHGGMAGPPSPASGVFALDAGRHPHPALFYSAPQPLHTWSAGRPRAPPLLA